jgi:hypothetical protein
MSLGRRGRRGRGLTVTGPGRSHWGQLTATDGEGLRIWLPPGGQPARRAERVGAHNTGRQKKPGQPPHDEGLAGHRGGERLEKVCHFGSDVGDVVEQCDLLLFQFADSRVFAGVQRGVALLLQGVQFGQGAPESR